MAKEIEMIKDNSNIAASSNDGAKQQSARVATATRWNYVRHMAVSTFNAFHIKKYIVNLWPVKSTM